MKQVYLAADALDARMCKDYLEANHIQAIIKGEFLSGAAGELPVNTYPSVWVIDDEDYDLALSKVRIYESREPKDQIHHSPWVCSQCGESIEAQFTQCWRCGAERS